MNGTGRELALVMPSGTVIKCDGMEEEDLLRIEGTTDYKFTYDKEKDKVYIKNKKGEVIFEQKKVSPTTYRTYRGSMDEEGALWICIEKWDIGGWYMGGYRRGYLENMPVVTNLYRIEPESGEVLFEEKEKHFYLMEKDGWVYFYQFGSEETEKKPAKNACIVRKSMEAWEAEELVMDMGYIYVPYNATKIFFELSEERLIISATNPRSEVVLEPIIVSLED